MEFVKFPVEFSPSMVTLMVDKRMDESSRLSIEEDGCQIVYCGAHLVSFGEGSLFYEAQMVLEGPKIDAISNELRKTSVNPALLVRNGVPNVVAKVFAVSFAGWPDEDRSEELLNGLVCNIASFFEEMRDTFCGKDNRPLAVIRAQIQSHELISEAMEASDNIEKEESMEQKQTGNRVTREEIEALMASAEFTSRKECGNTTVVTAKFPNGWTMTEQSACIDPDNYDHDLGVRLCKERIEDKLWMLEGYRKVCENAKEA